MLFNGWVWRLKGRGKARFLDPVKLVLVPPVRCCYWNHSIALLKSSPRFSSTFLQRSESTQIARIWRVPRGLWSLLAFNPQYQNHLPATSRRFSTRPISDSLSASLARSLRADDLLPFTVSSHDPSTYLSSSPRRSSPELNAFAVARD